MTQWKRPIPFVLGGALLALFASAWAPVAGTSNPPPPQGLVNNPSIYLKIEGLKDMGERGIPILSYRLGLANQTGERLSLAERASAVSIEDMVLVKRPDSSSPKFALACCEGERYEEAILSVGGSADQEPFSAWMEYKLSDVVITRYEVNSATPGVAGIGEVISLNFSRIEWRFVDPSQNEDVRAIWNLKLNKKE